MDNHLSACPICSNHTFKGVVSARDHLVSGETFEISSCTHCGLMSTDGVPPDNEMERYYKSEDYIPHSDIRKGLVNRAYHIVRKVMLMKKHAVVRDASGLQNGTVLDIGAGTGYFMRYMHEQGWEAHGTEKSSSAREFASKNLGTNIFPAEDLASLNPASYDAITLWHVMEHLSGLHDIWTSFTRLLKQEGTLVIAVPNPDSWDARHYGSHWAAWDVPRHLWHFGPGQMKMLARKFGFRLTGTFRMPYDAFYISIMSEKNRGSVFPLLKGLTVGKISWFLSLFDQRKCSSLIYVFKKQG